MIYGHILQEFSDKVVVVRCKNDLPVVQNSIGDRIVDVVICHDDAGVASLSSFIDQKITMLLSQYKGAFMLNARQHRLLVSLEQDLKNIRALLEVSPAYEIIALQLEQALTHMSELSGKSISERGMDCVFREFCVGK